MAMAMDIDQQYNKYLTQRIPRCSPTQRIPSYLPKQIKVDRSVRTPSLNEKAIECECCYMESLFDTMVQCYEGHLFCPQCLTSYSKEATFGSGKTQLQCMTADCDATFPFNQLRKALPENILTKFQEREQDEALKLANLENLFKCPYCPYAAVVNKTDQVFSCQNPPCMKKTCMTCNQPWDDNHFGISCAEVEKKDVTKLRTSYEEKMTQAKVRKCWQCSTIFLKSSGCNKMTCRCGAKMCYICREPNIDYSHFCQHPREPGQTCKRCNFCCMWTDPEEDDNRAIAEIQKEAEEERKKLAGEDNGITEFCKPIGPTIKVTAQKVKKQAPSSSPQTQQHQRNTHNYGAGGGGPRRRNRRPKKNTGEDWTDYVVNMQQVP